MHRTLFDSQRQTLDEAIRATIESLIEYGKRYQHWAIAYSGGKDSSALVTLVIWLIVTKQIPAPQSITILYADTRLEMPPLQICAEALMDTIRKNGFEAYTVLPSLDDRFLVYMLGRGVPPPTNTFRWCTPQLKVEPMQKALVELREKHGKLLMLTGVRLGESASRDSRISLSCTKNGSECGQGWFQTATPEAVADTLAPLIHWRICNVWDWLTNKAPYQGFPTTYMIADAYGGQNDVESLIDSNARTGCIGCNLTSKDQTLTRITSIPHWQYLSPLLILKPLWQELREHQNRLRKGYDERRADGSLVSNPGRIGPLKLEARQYGLETVLAIQTEVNEAAIRLGRPKVDLINAEEENRIKELIEANTWPNRWTGEEVSGETELLEEVQARYPLFVGD